MEIKKIFESNSFKVMNVTLNKGETMPNHKATSEAFIIVKHGKAKIIFDYKEIGLQHDSTQLIPANENHILEVMEDFSACIVFPIEGEIEFIK